jgi:predicted DNA-binding transcriptional regulator AlpA
MAHYALPFHVHSSSIGPIYLKSRKRAALEGPPIDLGSSEPRVLDVREAARRLGLSKSTLGKMRCAGTGPRFIRATARAVRYDPADLDAFANSRRRTSTMSEALSAIIGES